MTKLHIQMDKQNWYVHAHLGQGRQLKIINEVDETGCDHAVEKWTGVEVLERPRSCVFGGFGHLGLGCCEVEDSGTCHCTTLTPFSKNFMSQSRRMPESLCLAA